MSMSKKTKLYKEAINHLNKAFDLIEGIYSGIPECCIKGFLEGRTWLNVSNSLSEKDKKKFQKFNYVPCEKCRKANKLVKIKHNGTSLAGEIIFTLIHDINEKA